MEEWIKPGASVTSVVKKIIKPDHQELESYNSKNYNDDDNTIKSPKNDETIIEPLETHNTLLQEMDVDDINILPETNENLEKDETMEED